MSSKITYKSSDSDKAEFAKKVEKAKKFEQYSSCDYAMAKDWTISREDEKSWMIKHLFGNDAQREWIEALFEDINFCRECGCLIERDYAGFVNLMNAFWAE